MKIYDIINETHFTYNKGEQPSIPLKNEDSITLYHGFRDIDDAILTAKYGTSGAMRAARVYSYEGDNNPNGLFVTPKLETAKDFGSTVIEFDADMKELEPPVWPGGSYTGYGGYSQYWGRGREGRAKRSTAQNELRRKYKTSDSTPDWIRNSDDPLLAHTLFSMGEMQALYVGHLNPKRIKAVHLRDVDKKTRSYTSDWYTVTREEFLEKNKDFSTKETEKSRDIDNRVFEPDDTFNAEIFISRMKEKYKGYGDINKLLQNIWNVYVIDSKTNKGQAFKEQFNQFMWPKQMPDAFNWFKKTYGKKAG